MLDDSEISRVLVIVAHPDEDPIARPGWQFASSSSYGGIVYGKTTTALTTLEAVLGEGPARKDAWYRMVVPSALMNWADAL